MSLPDVPLAETVTGSLLLATLATLQGLELQGLNSERFHVQDFPWQTPDLVAPYVLISPATIGVDWNAGTNQRDDVTHGVIIAMVAAGQRVATDENLGIKLYWEEQVRRRFLNRDDMLGLELPAAFTLARPNVLPPSEAFLSAAKAIGWDAMYMIIGFQIRETRA